MPSTKRLRWQKLVDFAWGAVWSHRGVVLKLAAWPIAVSFGLAVALAQDLEVHASFVLSFLSLGPPVIFLVAVHRLFLGAEPAPVLRLTIRELRFFAWFVLVAPILVAPAAIGGAVNVLLGLGAGLGCVYLVGRLYLLLPGAAIDAKATPRTVWRLSSGNGWRLGVVALFGPLAAMLLTLPLQLAFELVPENPGEVAEATRTALESAATTALEYLAMTFEAAALSFSWRTLSRDSEASAIAV